MMFCLLSSVVPGSGLRHLIAACPWPQTEEHSCARYWMHESSLTLKMLWRKEVVDEDMLAGVSRVRIRPPARTVATTAGRS